MVAHVDRATVPHQRFIFFRTESAQKLHASMQPHVKLGLHTCQYSWSSDVCAGKSHKRWSLSCALAESLFLDRILVVPDVLCCHPFHCGGKEVCAPTTEFFALDGPHVALESQLEAVHLRPTLIGCNATTAYLASRLSQVAAVQYERMCTSYYFLRCEGARRATGGVHLERTVEAHQPWDVPAATLPAINGIVAAIKSTALHANANAWCVHVRRGDKLDKRYWPCTSLDTSPSSIEQTLLHNVPIPRGSILYIATNERRQRYFDLLKQSFRVYTLNDFASLIPSRAGPEAHVNVDYGVCNELAPRIVETFRNGSVPKVGQSQTSNHDNEQALFLTTDLKHGCPVTRTRRVCEMRYRCMTRGYWSYSNGTDSPATAIHLVP